jgi:D-amino peptidase
MDVLISVDMEGIAGIDDASDMREFNTERFAKSRKLMTGETNAAVEACLEAGVNKVYVVDGHAAGKNIIRDQLHSSAIFLEKEALRMMEGIDKNVDFCLFIGYHGRSSVLNSFTSHSYSSKIISRVKLNGVEVGEAELNAALGKFLGVKLLFVSGTDYAINEINIKGLRTLVTKESVRWFESKSFPVQDMKNKMKISILDAFSNSDSVSFTDFPTKNVNFEVEFNLAFLLEDLSEKRINEKTITFDSDNVYEGFKKLMQILMSATARYERAYST